MEAVPPGAEVVEEEAEGKEEPSGVGGGDAVATAVVAALNHKELGKSQVPTLEVGDVIEADLWRSNLGGGKVRRGGGEAWVLEGRSGSRERERGPGRDCRAWA